jgi:hypothetical protein
MTAMKIMVIFLIISMTDYVIIVGDSNVPVAKGSLPFDGGVTW